MRLGAATSSITPELYVLPMGYLLMSYRCSAPALQADLRLIPTTGGRGACPSRWGDCTSRGKTRQMAVVARYRGISRLAACFHSVRAIRNGYSCAYARHTPHANKKYPSTGVGWRSRLRVLCAALAV